MIRRLIVPALALLAVLASLQQVQVAEGTVPINFTRGILSGAGFSTDLPTAIAIGPDGRLYVAGQDGSIKALTIDSSQQITNVQTITTNTQIQEIFGIAFDPTDASNPPPIYITNTVSGFGDASPAPASGSPGSYAGKVTKIHGAGYTIRQDIITGLPVSNSGHESNGLTFGPDGRLYIAQGGTTNAGLIDPDGGLFQRHEVPTGGAVLVADIKAPGFNGNITYSEPNIYSPTVDQTGGDVTAFAYGLRNPYDLLFHTNGKFYLTDNGPNPGVGPQSTGCATEGADPQAPDELNIIVEGEYYGHPNRNRGLAGDARQCVYHPGTDPSNAEYTAPIGLLPASSNGIIDYASDVFEGQMQHDLLYVSWVENTLHRVQLSGDGSSVVSDTILAGNLQTALDVTQAVDGTIYVAEYSTNQISYFKPDETPVSDITVTAVQPGGGPLTGGQSVTITGTNFTTTAETTVTFDGVPATNIAVVNSTTITAVTPANPQGPVDITVTNSIGSDTLVNGYQYSAGGGTTPPIAVAGEDVNTPVAHENHAHVTIDGRASFDPDGFITQYEWREGTTVLSTNAVDSLQLPVGTHNITLTVWDNENPPYFDTDDVRVVVTSEAENPNPWYCFDPNGDGVPNVGDQAILSSNYGKKFLQAGYAAVRDFNSDRVINVGDQAKMAGDVLKYPGSSGGCPLIDRQIRAGVVAAEPYSWNIQNAFNAGYTQITPWIPGQGRHLAKGGIAAADDVFDPGAPESLLYEPDPSTPGGWRLGGLMYIIPVTLSPLPPDGFATLEDAWHYHSGLCLWNNYTAVQENVAQSTCLARSGNPVWIEKAGWLVHIWSFVPNPKGRFVEVSENFVGLP